MGHIFIEILDGFFSIFKYVLSVGSFFKNLDSNIVLTGIISLFASLIGGFLTMIGVFVANHLNATENRNILRLENMPILFVEGYFTSMTSSKKYKHSEYLKINEPYNAHISLSNHGKGIIKSFDATITRKNETYPDKFWKRDYLGLNAVESICIFETYTKTNFNINETENSSNLRNCNIEPCIYSIRIEYFDIFDNFYLENCTLSFILGDCGDDFIAIIELEKERPILMK